MLIKTHNLLYDDLCGLNCDVLFFLNATNLTQYFKYFKESIYRAMGHLIAMHYSFFTDTRKYIGK